jgi:hypothetical protein
VSGVAVEETRKWNIGKLEPWSFGEPIIPIFHHSNYPQVVRPEH